MNLVVDDDYKETKEWMKKLASGFRLARRNSEKDSQYRYFDELLNFYSVTKFLPINIDDVIVNKILLKQYLWRLRQYNVSYEIKNDTLILNYESRNSNIVGNAHFRDLSKFYKYLPEIPKGELI